jgi:hypothetical protein
MSTSTPGATIFFTTSHYGVPPDPTHSGGTQTGTTAAYNHSFTVPYMNGINSVLYIKALAYKAGFTDSAVSFDLCDNTGN